MVRRMDVIATVDETHWGEYVEYNDYAALEAENARLREALRECVNSATVASEYLEKGIDAGYVDPTNHGPIMSGFTKAREVLGDASA